MSGVIHGSLFGLERVNVFVVSSLRS